MRSRRLSALPLLFALAAVACGGASDEQPGSFPTSSDASRNIPPENVQPVNAVVAGTEWTVGWNNFVFGITDANDRPRGGAKATATFYDLADPNQPRPVVQVAATESAPGVGPEVTHTHASGEKHVHGGEDQDRVGYFVRVRFDHPGEWGVSVEATLADGAKGTSNVSFLVLPEARIPAAGQPALRSRNLVAADVSDIREIDSGDPPNDMHDVRIAEALDAGRPIVIVFATPAFCISRFCGPVVEEVESLRDAYRDRVDFVHIEIWRDFAAKRLNETAQEWLLRPDGGLSEPFVYIVDRAGTIYDRYEGPVARNILEPAVRAVAEGRTFEAN